MSASSVYSFIMQKIHRPDMICQMVCDRSLHPDKVMDAVEQGIQFQKTVFGVDYDLYEITKNLMELKKFVQNYIDDMMPKRLREWDEDVELGVGLKRKRI